jgi:hypothetical protein
MGLVITHFLLVSAKGAKGANFCTSGFGTLAGQKLVSKAAKLQVSQGPLPTIAERF